MIDMRDDAEVTGQLDRHGGLHYAGVPRDGQRTGPPERLTAEVTENPPALFALLIRFGGDNRAHTARSVSFDCT
jgi:hypothetical protein